MRSRMTAAVVVAALLVFAPAAFAQASQWFLLNPDGDIVASRSDANFQVPEGFTVVEFTGTLPNWPGKTEPANAQLYIWNGGDPIPNPDVVELPEDRADLDWFEEERIKAALTALVKLVNQRLSTAGLPLITRQDFIDQFKAELGIS